MMFTCEGLARGVFMVASKRDHKRKGHILSVRSLSAIVRCLDVSLPPILTEIVPVKWHREMFTHTLEGPDDMTGHVKVMPRQLPDI